MRYNQPRNIKDYFVTLINKIFSLNSEWVNSTIEVIELSGENIPQAVEQYPWDTENYPIVVLASGGVQDDPWAIDSKIGTYQESLHIGSIPREIQVLSQYPKAFGVYASDTNMLIRSVAIPLQYVGPYEEAVTVKIWSAAGGDPFEVLASGSMQGTEFTGTKWFTTGISPRTILTHSTNYFVSLECASGSYQMFLDTSPSETVTPFISLSAWDGASWTTNATQTGLARVNGPAHRRLGGGSYCPIRVFIEAKDLATTQQISDLLYVYLHVIKHSNVKRGVQLPSPNQTRTLYDFVSSLTDEGIYIIDVSKGPEAVRNRGNDRLFSIEIALNCYSFWTEDFDLSVLESFDLDIDSFS